MVQTLIKPKSKEMKYLSAGPYTSFSVQIVQDVLKKDYFPLLITCILFLFWFMHLHDQIKTFHANISVCRLLKRHQLPSLYLSKFIFDYTQLRPLSTIHLKSFPPHISEPLYTPFSPPECPPMQIL